MAFELRYFNNLILTTQKHVSSKLFLMCQMVASDNKLGNCDDGSAYIRALVNIEAFMFIGS